MRNLSVADFNFFPFHSQVQWLNHQLYSKRICHLDPNMPQSLDIAALALMSSVMKINPDTLVMPRCLRHNLLSAMPEIFSLNEQVSDGSSFVAGLPLGSHKEKHLNEVLQASGAHNGYHRRHCLSFRHLETL